jgi:hypothetical protein
MKKKRLLSSLLIVCTLSIFQCSDDDEAPKSEAREILSFKLSSLTPEVVGEISNAEKKISLAVPHGTVVTALTPVIEVSEKATVSPASEVPQNFSAPVTYTVTAENGTTQEYLVTVTLEEVCLPTTLPGEETYFKLTYNHDHTSGTHTIDYIDYLHFDVPEPGKYKADFSYMNGKLSRIDYLANSAIESYVTFEYPSGKIIENHFNKMAGGNFEKEKYYIYHLQDNKITSWGYHDKYYDYEMRDSLVFTYNNAGNITHADGYNPNKVKEYTLDYLYDDKPSPYKLAGINDADNEFYRPVNLSVNNVTKLTYKYLFPASEEVETTSYTYDAAGRPLTRIANWDGGAIRSMAYTCH